MSAVPQGWHTVTPRIFVDDPARLVAFMKSVFGAMGESRSDRPSVMTIGDSIVMVSGSEIRGVMPAFLYVYVDDTDATYTKALAAGAISLEEPQVTPYGDRRAMFADPCGCYWQIATYAQPA